MSVPGVCGESILVAVEEAVEVALGGKRQDLTLRLSLMAKGKT